MALVSSVPICYINPDESFKRLRIIGEGGSKIVWLVNELFSKTLKVLAQFRLPSDLEQDEFVDEETIAKRC